MISARRRWGLGLSGIVGMGLAMGPASLAAAPTETPPATDPPTSPAAPVEDTPAALPDATQIVDTTLPCGLRVIVAQDLTLPVAAVVLAVETGTEDDPGDSPGLVHALAYHLFQGNREYAPGGIARLVHGAGGMTTLAIGPAQVRYESLVPASLLGETIVAEASRLRAPNVSAALWKDTLRWARRDRSRTWNAPAALRASAHQAEGLRHDGHVVSESVAALSERAVSSQLGERFAYDRASLVVVAPGEPAAVLEQITAAFADLPATPRAARDRTAPPSEGAAPRAVVTKGVAPGTFVWAIPADAAGQAWADVVCGAINRLRRATHEPSRVRVRCTVDDDARRGVMIVKATGVDDPAAAVADRLTRVRADDDEAVTKERAVVAERLRYATRTPIALARHLARARSPGRAPGDPTTRPATELLGAAAVTTATSVPDTFKHLLEIGSASVAADTPHDKPHDKPKGTPP